MCNFISVRDEVTRHRFIHGSLIAIDEGILIVFLSGAMLLMILFNAFSNSVYASFAFICSKYFQSVIFILSAILQIVFCVIDLVSINIDLSLCDLFFFHTHGKTGK